MDQHLEHKRHTLAHLLALAVRREFPHARPTIGPAIETGFYYDFDFSGGAVPSEADIKQIEKNMKKALSSWTAFSHRVVSPDEAREVFKDNPYKTELINDLEKSGETITLYTVGEGHFEFTDLCRGGHSESPATDIDVDSFKLTTLAGAYWRGDEKNPMLTRIYGLAFNTKDELDAYLVQIEEAKKRDHRKLGQEMGLFAISDLVGKGLPLFLPKGNMLREALASFVRSEKEKLGYQFVHIPHIAKRDLYERSGHMGKYDAMMPTMTDAEGVEYVMKAMNCPHHFELFNATPHSYKELPIRFAETTTVYRNEKSGELSGLLRVKALTQDDTHHFVREDQIESEIQMVLDLMRRVYSVFGFSDFKVEVSVRDPHHKENYFGDDSVWQKAEDKLVEIVKRWGVSYEVKEGEAAFYGPKIDVRVKDALGRDWQLTTVQLDFNQPVNFNLEYTGQDGQKHLVVVIHVAILGSIERFLGVLIEHFGGNFPLWMSPEQIRIIPVSDIHNEYATQVYDGLKAIGIRTTLDDTNDSMGKKIRNAKKDRLPYFVVVGDKEVAEKTVTVESRNGESIQVPLGTLGNRLLTEIETKAL